MNDLIDHEIGIGDTIVEHEWPLLREGIRLEMGFDGGYVANAVGLTVFGISGVFVWRKESYYEKSTP